VPLSSRDCAALAALHAGVFPQGWSEADFRGFLHDRAVYGFAIQGREPAGFILCRLVAGEAEVLSFGVASPHRRRGGGRALLALAMAEAARRAAHVPGSRGR
jgi:[ribosomal protein S18]-alanine N-acetyltransferase